MAVQPALFQDPVIAGPAIWLVSGSQRHLPRVLSLDSHGRIQDWITWREAAHLYARDAVAWTLGEPCFSLRGGINRRTGLQSHLDLHPIVAARGHARASAAPPSPALNNAALFARDARLCLYCGQEFSRYQLTRDHVMPRSQGGRDVWENVVTACLACNTRKGGRTPAQAQMPLLAVPYRPSWVEHLILCNRNILADQMDFLRSHLPRRPARTPAAAGGGSEISCAGAQIAAAGAQSN